MIELLVHRHLAHSRFVSRGSIFADRPRAVNPKGGSYDQPAVTLDAGVLLARVLLSAVLGTAAVAKLVDVKAGRAALVDFGVPRPLARPLAIVLPAIELLTAAALLSHHTAVGGGVAAIALLAAFTLAISLNLATGHRPDCHCFGQVSSHPVDWSSLLRNVALGGCAAFVAAAGPGVTWRRAFDWIGTLSAPALASAAGGIALLAILALQWSIILSLVRQNGRLLVRVEALEERAGVGRSAGLPVGAHAPAFSLPGRNGEEASLASMLSENGGNPLVLIFSDPGCGPCRSLLPQLADWERNHSDAVTLTIVTRRGADTDGLSESEKLFRRVLIQKDLEVMESYGAPGTPAAVMIRQDGTIGSSVALGADAIKKLLADLADSSLQ